MENAAKNENGFTAADFFDWDKLLGQNVLMQFIGFAVYAIILAMAESGMFRAQFWKVCVGARRVLV